ncbi:MAG: hypothetical protein M1834_002542 [Cirrosporium novae-zelandiae]|nr:MAG: hypothetical protein M1834_002542 [Cirrosporium novae-zelandiae]
MTSDEFVLRQNGIRFLDLPGEIRNQIYDYAFVPSDPVIPSWEDMNLPTDSSPLCACNIPFCGLRQSLLCHQNGGFLGSCRQISLETKDYVKYPDLLVFGDSRCLNRFLRCASRRQLNMVKTLILCPDFANPEEEDAWRMASKKAKAALDLVAKEKEKSENKDKDKIQVQVHMKCINDDMISMVGDYTAHDFYGHFSRGPWRFVRGEPSWNHDWMEGALTYHHAFDDIFF